ncbi:kelch 8 [Fusarium sp. NRRL 52700]|nr:kelch 8 [Fusarium sp. NRRL 52700]
MEPKPIDAFGASLQGYYNNKCLSDVVIRCNGQEFAVHGLVLFCHSDYFKKQLTGPWKESDDRIIDIKDFDSNIVEAMLRFIYSFDYNVPPDTPALVFHAKVYQIGDKYRIETLKQHSLDNFKSVIKEAEATAEYASDLADAITTVYTTTPSEDRGLRDIVMESSCKVLDELMSNEAFQEGLEMNGDFSADLLRRITSRRDRGDTYEWKCDRFEGDEYLALVKAMAIFFYYFNYKHPADSLPMKFHAKVCQIADKYGIDALKRLAATKYHTSIDAGWEMDSFSEAIELAYTTMPPGDRGLRDIDVKVTIKRIETLMSKDAFCEMLSTNPDLAADIIRTQRRDSEKSREDAGGIRKEFALLCSFLRTSCHTKTTSCGIRS